MKYVLWLLKWLLKVTLFLGLLAFALNNQQDVTVSFFPGRQWTAPLVAVVLGSFVIGVLAGAVGMMPHWWRQRRLNRIVDAKASEEPSGRAAQPMPVGPDGH